MNTNTPRVKYHDYPAGPQRESILKAQAEKSEDKEIFRQLSPAEVSAAEHELASLAVEIAGHDKVLEDAKIAHKKATIDLKNQYTYVRDKIRNKGEQVIRTVHSFMNYNSFEVEFFDNEGIFIESRAMMPSEKNAFLAGQGTTPIISLNGTTD